jgi:hypothetical protein
MTKEDTFGREDLKEYQDENEGEHESGKGVSRAEHQAKNDYQDEGEPFGPLTDRDRDTKEDVPSKPEEDAPNEDAKD